MVSVCCLQVEDCEDYFQTTTVLHPATQRLGNGIVFVDAFLRVLFTLIVLIGDNLNLLAWYKLC